MHPAGYERASSSSHPSRRAPIVAAHGGSEPNLDGETDTQKQARAPMKGVKEHASRAQPAVGGGGCREVEKPPRNGRRYISAASPRVFAPVRKRRPTHPPPASPAPTT